MKVSSNPIMSAIRAIVPPLLLCSASFIFCMHWFLLMADTQASGITSDVIPAPILSTIIGYYTVVFGPMTWLIKIFILVMLLSMTLQLAIKEIPWYIRWTIFITNAPLVFNGVFHIIPLVDRLILNTATPEVQSQMVRTVHTAHVVSEWAAALMVVLQLITVIRLQRQAENKYSAITKVFPQDCHWHSDPVAVLFLTVFVTKLSNCPSISCHEAARSMHSIRITWSCSSILSDNL